MNSKSCCTTVHNGDTIVVEECRSIRGYDTLHMANYTEGTCHDRPTNKYTPVAITISDAMPVTLQRLAMQLVRGGMSVVEELRKHLGAYECSVAFGSDSMVVYVSMDIGQWYVLPETDIVDYLDDCPTIVVSPTRYPTLGTVTTMDD